MANSYTQLHIHIVFAVQDRRNLIAPANRETLHKLLTGIVQARGCRMLAVQAVQDHVHMNVGLTPKLALSDLMRDAKSATAKHANDAKWSAIEFRWQTGYAAFAVSKSRLPAAIKYVLHQEEHHRRVSFKEEYLEFLKNLEIEFDERYLFEFY